MRSVCIPPTVSYDEECNNFIRRYQPIQSDLILLGVINPVIITAIFISTFINSG